VVTALHDFTLVEDDNFVSILDGTQAMSDDDHGQLAKLNQLFEGLLDLGLTLGVQGTGGLVQEKNLGLADESTGDGHTLLLPTRELDSSSSDQSLITVRELFSVLDEIVDGGLLADFVKQLQKFSFGFGHRVLTFCIFGVGVSVLNSIEYVVSNGVLEEAGLLHDNGHLRVIPSAVEGPDVTAVESYAPL